MEDDEPGVGRLIDRRKWTWIGHMLWKPIDHITRQALTWNPSGKCRHGRPRNTWRRCVESEIKKEGQSWAKLEKVVPIENDGNYWLMTFAQYLNDKAQREHLERKG